jgi:hypothetical protein
VGLGAASAIANRRQRDYTTPFSRRERPFSVQAIAGRLLLSLVLAGTVVAAGLVGLICESGSAFASRLGEPLLLLLLPGLCAALLSSEPHTFARSNVLDVSLGVYFAGFVLLLTALALGRASAAPRKADSR